MDRRLFSRNLLPNACHTDSGTMGVKVAVEAAHLKKFLSLIHEPVCLKRRRLMPVRLDKFLSVFARLCNKDPLLSPTEVKVTNG